MHNYIFKIGVIYDIYDDPLKSANIINYYLAKLKQNNTETWLGFDYINYDVIVNNDNVKVCIWDINRMIPKYYMHKLDILIAICDMNKEDSYKNIRHKLSDIRQHNSSLKIMIIEHILDKFNKNKFIACENIFKFANNNNISYYGIIVTKSEVNNIFNSIIKQLYYKKYKQRQKTMCIYENKIY